MTTCTACKQPLTVASASRLHPTCDVSPDILATELFQLIEADIIGQPRSQQTRIGPSELGVPCDRRIGYHLAGVPKVNDRGPAWKPYVGTAVHEQMATLMAKAEVGRWDDEAVDSPRWMVEQRVTVGRIGAVEITGSCDLFDAHHGAVWDWKFTTRNQIREHYRPHGPGEQYRAQAHLYGRGFASQGYDVRTVGVVFFTRDGEFTDRYVWHEPYDEAIAVAALERATSIQSALEALGRDFTIPTLPTADAHCRFCPWHDPRASQIGRACPGHPQEAAQPRTLTQLIGA